MQKLAVPVHAPDKDHDGLFFLHGQLYGTLLLKLRIVTPCRARAVLGTSIETHIPHTPPMFLRVDPDITCLLTYTHVQIQLS